MAEYKDRLVTCLQCGESLQVADAGQMLRFRYLCGDCMADGYKLGAFTDGPPPPRRWYVFVMRAGRIVERKGAESQHLPPLWGPA